MSGQGEGATVDEVVGRLLSGLGVRQIFGVVGSGNFVTTSAMIAAGARFVASRDEHGAAMMADGYSRVTGEVAAVSVHQGCGLTNALTGLTEAAKSRTPLIVISGDTPATTKQSNFWIDQDAAASALGIVAERVHGAATVVEDVVRAYRRARHDRRTVLLSMPLDVQTQIVAGPIEVPDVIAPALPAPAPDAVRDLADLLATARRPVLVAGRGGLNARAEIARLAELTGALLATSAVARGLFNGDPWYLDLIGGFATPTTTRLVTDADVVVSFGASLNRWTTQDGGLLQNATVAHVDIDSEAIGFHHETDLAVIGDSSLTAVAVTEELRRRDHHAVGYRTPEIRTTIADGWSWASEPYEDTSTDALIDPRVLSTAVDAILPTERIVVPDGGNFNCYPAMFLRVPDAQGFVLPMAFQSIGLSLSAAIGAAVANPDRVAVAAVGDGGLMMSLAELDTAVRLGLSLVVLVYDDHAYGAEVHHFTDEGVNHDTVTFPDTDIAAIARGFGCEGITVRKPSDLDALQSWVDGPRDRPILVDAKITSFPSWMLAHTFTAH
ncbi:MAG TPA: thiamine pyrophosphate-binding protein [Baekduia sp.]|nr:thiamine pyrophosphate-binding protein [Baekduia sp.]